jgi:hypothetical protein
MAYRVEVAQAAEAELEALYLWVVSRAPSQGAAWFNGLERAVLALDERPERCPVGSLNDGMMKRTSVRQRRWRCAAAFAIAGV